MGILFFEKKNSTDFNSCEIFSIEKIADIFLFDEHFVLFRDV